jgi:hypothetical protein
VPDGKIWEYQKFVGCADEIYNLGMRTEPGSGPVANARANFFNCLKRSALEIGF